MKTLTLEEVVTAVGGRPLGPPAVASVAAVSTDRRQVRAGELFFALRGPQHDGHDFVDAALSAGAVAAVVSDAGRVARRGQEAGRLICVRDTVEALGRLAAYHRGQIAAQVVAVAGSNGKTTTKGLIEHVLRTRRRGRAAPRSFNNEIGVPLTLLSAEASDEFLVVEIGTNHPGEVAALAQLARPDAGVVTSIGEEHLEFFGDLPRVADEEMSLLRGLRARGFAVVPFEYRAHPAAQRADLTIVTFGPEPAADLRAGEARWDGGAQRFLVNGRFEYALPAMGAHNVGNALAAAAVGLRFGLTHEEIAAALATAPMPPMRLERRAYGAVTLINDAYNANPASMRAALATFERIPDGGRRVLILGDMRELGEAAARYHAELGRTAGRSSAAVIVAVGAQARTVADGATETAGPTKRIHWFPNLESAGPGLERLLEAGDLVLRKGSRAEGLERLIPFVERAGRARAVRPSRTGRKEAPCEPGLPLARE
jgi:UDP-N-acetylmuramoyl-tripeptide--D-alanyl-D-alanine ligase